LVISLKIKRIRRKIMSAYVEVEGNPVAFYPYTSCVMDRIFVIRDYSEIPEIKKLRQELIDFFQACKINARIDNKIAFELDVEGKRIFYGFYDWTFSIGFSVRSDSWVKPITRID
jgi:hypothetical protein